jgi:hypothetical protein
MKLASAIRCPGILGVASERASDYEGGVAPALPPGSLPGFERGIVKYATDFLRLGARSQPLLLEPGSMHVAHTPEEQGHSALREQGGGRIAGPCVRVAL